MRFFKEKALASQLKMALEEMLVTAQNLTALLSRIEQLEARVAELEK